MQQKLHHGGKRCVAGVKVLMGTEFTERFACARQTMSTMRPSPREEGLLHEPEKVASDYKRGDIAEGDCFLQKHNIIRVKK